MNDPQLPCRRPCCFFKCGLLTDRQTGSLFFLHSAVSVKLHFEITAEGILPAELKP